MTGICHPTPLTHTPLTHTSLTHISLTHIYILRTMFPCVGDMSIQAEGKPWGQSIYTPSNQMGLLGGQTKLSSGI
jgi:hypothetical protein